MIQHYYDDTDDPAECHWCGLNYYEAQDLHFPLEPGRVVVWSLYGLRRGLCDRREPHGTHQYKSATLGEYWCSGSPEDREPDRSRRRWAQ